MIINKLKLKGAIFTIIYLLPKILIYLLPILYTLLILRLSRQVCSNEFFKKVE